jgi:hypothetical protein
MAPAGTGGAKLRVRVTGRLPLAPQSPGADTVPPDTGHPHRIGSVVEIEDSLGSPSAQVAVTFIGGPQPH